MIDLEKLRERYTGVEPGNCRVCGHELTPGLLGPEKCEYYCDSYEAKWLVGAGKTSQEKDEAAEHWRNSKVTIYPSQYGDPEVLALIKAFETLLDGNAE